MERATLARKSEQGQFDDSAQVKAKKAQDVRLLKERRLDEYEPQEKAQYLGKAGLAKVPTTKNNMIPVGKAGILKVPARQGNILDEAIGNVATGAGNLILSTLNTINSVVQSPATVGKYGTQEMNKAKAEGKNPAIGLLKGYGTGLKKAITGQEATANTEVIEGIAPKTTAALKEKYPGAYNLASNIANFVDITDLLGLGIISDISKIQKMGKLPDSTKALIKTGDNAQKLAEISIKTKAGEALTVDEKKLVEAVKHDIMYVDPYGNVRKTPTTDLLLGTPKQNLPKVDNFNSITKTVGKPEKTILIGNPIENTINKVSTKKIKLTPEEIQLDNAIKRSGTNINELIGEAEKKVKDIEEQQFQYLKGNKAKGVQSANIIRDDTGTVTGRFGKVSNNDRWYREFYAENKRPPTNAEMREMAKKQLYEGFGTDTMDIPSNEEYIQAVKDLESYSNIKGVNTPLQSIPSTITKKGIQPTPQLIPSTLRQKGRTLTTDKPIRSALDARLNKPQITPGKNIESPFRLTPAELARTKAPIANQKVSEGINTLPIGKNPLKNDSDVKLGKATWKNKDYDTPIEVIGDYGTINGKKYVKIKGSDTGVPLDEIRYADEVAATKEVPAVSKIGKEIETEMEGATHTSNNFIKEIAPTIKDAKFGASFSMTDIYRNFKHAFGKNYEAVKKSVLDPFDASKKAYIDEQKLYTDGLYNNVVKKLDINKNTKESSAVQWFGEGKKMSGVEETIDPQTGQKIKKAVEVPYTLEDLKKDFPDKWQNIVEADKWFRKSYDELIDKVNATVKQIYPSNPDKIVPKRADYYRHFKEMTNGFEGLRNVFDSPSNIDPKLVGISEFTQPKTKWQSFKQKRGLGEYKADAVGGFLDYIKAAAYSIHIDPQINVFRSMAKDIAETTEQSKNANNFIKFLRGYADDLAGKTNSIDRPFMNETNRQFMNIVNAGNVRIKKNTVLMNAKSALSQLANVPLGVAKVKNPIHISKGVGETLAGFVGKGKAPDAYKQSQFITERYADKLYRRFDTKLLDQPEKFASWLLESTDELGTKMIWNSVHNQAIAKGIKDPIKYADDVTRSLVAGRGIGEVPLAQKAKVFQIVAPFQLEVANQWHVMKDFINEKDFAAIPILLLGNYLFNNAVQSVTGSRVTFDPINAMEEALSEDNTNLFQKGYNFLAKGEKPTLNKDITPLQLGGRVGGEVLSNVPLGSTFASQLPEATRMKYFGRTDPTRFGTGLMLTKGLQDPLYKLLPPMGGGQIKKSIEGLKSVQILPKDLQGNKQEVSGSYNKDKLRFPVEKTPANIAKAALFGQYSSKEAVEYFRRNGRELSEEQTKQLENWVKSGRDPKTFYDNILKDRELNKLKSELSKVNKNDKLTLAEKQKERFRITSEIKKLGK
jgi:hypothetical protein